MLIYHLLIDRFAVHKDSMGKVCFKGGETERYSLYKGKIIGHLIMEIQLIILHFK